MSTPRERQLAEGIKNKLMAIQNSEEIYEHLAQWQKRVLRMSRREINQVATKVAANVECYVVTLEKRNKKQPSSKVILKKIKEEFEKL